MLQAAAASEAEADLAAADHELELAMELAKNKALTHHRIEREREDFGSLEPFKG